MLEVLSKTGSSIIVTLLAILTAIDVIGAVAAVAADQSARREGKRNAAAAAVEVVEMPDDRPYISMLATGPNADAENAGKEKMAALPAAGGQASDVSRGNGGVVVGSESGQASNASRGINSSTENSQQSESILGTDSNTYNFNINLSSEYRETVENQTDKLYYAIGEHAIVDGVSVTLVGIERSAGGLLFQPKPGMEYVFCEFDIENNSNSDIVVSSFLSFDAYVDDYSTSLDLSATVSADKTSLDGKVPVGKKIRGAVGYEVPIGWKTLEMRFTPDFWFGGTAIFTVDSDQIG